MRRGKERNSDPFSQGPFKPLGTLIKYCKLSVPPRFSSRLINPIIMTLFSSSNLVMSAYAFVVYIIGLYLYRMFLDPLSKFPGPKMAAATLWYEFYYDVIKKGRYTWKIAEMHDKYGTSSCISYESIFYLFRRRNSYKYISRCIDPL